MPLIDRANATALINQQNTAEILEQAAHQSAALNTFRVIQMGSKELRMPVIDALPTAGFLASDNTAKPTVTQTWTNKILTAEEIAVIVPIPENVFEDAEFDIWANVRPRIAEAIGATLDAAVFFGTGKPTSWPAALIPGAVAAANTISSADNAGDLAEDINAVMSLVEADGFDPDTIWTNRVLRGRLRGLRDSTGAPIYNQSFRDTAVDSVYGLQIAWVRNGSWIAAGGTSVAPTGAHALVGDSNAAILGIRSDIDYKILTEATVGGFNLAEQDMIALRCKMRVAFQVASHRTLEGGATAYPFAVLRT